MMRIEDVEMTAGCNVTDTVWSGRFGTAVSPSFCSVFRAAGAHGPPPLSAHLLDDAAVLWDFFFAALRKS